MWFCESCNHLLHEKYFDLQDIVAQLASHEYLLSGQSPANLQAMRTCDGAARKTFLTTD
jgi:hypothetical protein